MQDKAINVLLLHVRHATLAALHEGFLVCVPVIFGHAFLAPASDVREGSIYKQDRSTTGVSTSDCGPKAARHQLAHRDAANNSATKTEQRRSYRHGVLSAKRRSFGSTSCISGLNYCFLPAEPAQKSIFYFQNSLC